MGSKRKLAKFILPIVLENRTEGQWYVEPFCGGANIIDKVTGNRIGNDINRYLIALLRWMQEERFSFPIVSEEEYKRIKEDKELNYPDWLIGYAGFQLSFGAKWFGGYRRDKKGISGIENEIKQNATASKSLFKQAELLKEVEFTNFSYQDLAIPENSIIYCDPPYANTTKYKDKFDSESFWNWCNQRVEEGHTVFVSEYQAPEDWTCVWEKEVTTGLDTKTTKKSVEKLFTRKKE